jgi:hypothetical protein
MYSHESYSLVDRGWVKGLVADVEEDDEIF